MHLGIRNYFVHYLAFQRPWVAPLKYPLQTVATLRAKWTSVAYTLNILAWISLLQNDVQSALSFQQENLAICRTLGDQRGIAYSVNNLGYMLWRQGDLDRAASLHEESVGIARALGLSSNDVASSPTSQNIADVIVILGKDYKS